MKNVAGYDVSRAAGRLARHAGPDRSRSRSRCCRSRRREATLRFELSQAEALAQLNDWGGQPLPLNASAWWDGGADRCACAARAAAVEAACDQLGGERDRAGRTPARSGQACATSATSSSSPQRRDRRGATCGGCRCRRRRRCSTSPATQLIEWDGGQRWLRAPPPAAHACARPRPRVGGHATLFRGGDKRAGRVRAAGAAAATRIHRELKTRLRSGRHLQSRPPLSRALSLTHANQSRPNSQGTPEGDEAEAILRKCVHCGFCTATCPTYQLLGDELDGPRGRIYLIKQVLEGERADAQDAAAPGPLPHLPQLRNHLPVRRAVRPPGRHRPQDRRRAGAAPGRPSRRLRWR